MNKLVGIYNTDESFVKVIIIPFLDFLKGIHTYLVWTLHLSNSVVVIITFVPFTFFWN